MFWICSKNFTWAIFLVRVVYGTIAFPVALEGLFDAVAVVANKVREVTVCELEYVTFLKNNQSKEPII